MLYKAESAALCQRFAQHDFIGLLGAQEGCVNGCNAGILYYRQTEYVQGGVHEDQEVFFVLAGSGWAKIGNEEFELSPGTAFVAPAGEWHYIKRSDSCSFIKLFFTHAAVR